MGSIDTMFSTLGGVPTWAGMIGGFAIVIAVILMGVAVFGRNKQELGAFGFSMLTFVGVLIASLLGLFPWYIIILFLVIGLVIVLMSKIFGGYNG